MTCTLCRNTSEHRKTGFIEAIAERRIRMDKKCLGLLSLLLSTLAPLGVVGCSREPQEAIEAFLHATHVPEEQLADPLILTRCRAAPTIIRMIADKSMPRRRYAIGYLGNRRCSEAMPELKRIAVDEGEELFFRADALEAITQIDTAAGMLLAEPWASRQDILGGVSRAILRGEEVGLVRTYWQALGTH